MAFPLQEYIASLDNACLPKVLQVCSGVYFQGSVYEISGNEVCFSTGDIIKVTSLKLSSVCCEDVSNNERFEIPINHTGLLKVIPEETPYSTVEELVRLRPLGLDSSLHVTFTSRSKLALADITLGAGSVLTLLSVVEKDELCRCRVHLGPGQASAEVEVPLGTRGEFYMHEGEERFTPMEIVTSPHLRSQRFHFDNAAMCKRTLVLSPIYQIHAIMSMRKNILCFPSSLAVDVVDITDKCEDINFVTPLSLPDVHSQEDQTFPMVVEVLEGPDTRTMFKCSWLAQLQKGTRLIFHQKATSHMTLMSTLKSRKGQQYFLVSKQYAARFRRRPRGFDSAYKLYMASTQTPGLRVSITRDCEEVEEEGLPGLSVGERLEVIGCQKVELPCGHVDAVVCQRLEDMDDDEEGEKLDHIYLPLYMEGHFVELLADTKKYTLDELVEKVPMDVKVVSRDPELESDPLVEFPSLRIEGGILEPTIQASFLHTPDRCFEMPIQRICMTVYCTQQPLPWPPNQAPKCTVDCVTEVTDKFLYQFQKETLAPVIPPPRPPKWKLSTPKTSKTFLTKDFDDMTLGSKRISSPLPATTANVSHLPPPLTPRKSATPQGSAARAMPNTYVGVGTKVTGLDCDEEANDSDNPYEQVDDLFAVVLKKAEKTFTFI
ncbi:protein THEMIS2 [Syngnathoides biaculeatus]|uniref:protein THEMIS2 n=1 Tax=Syngnathoides biaculeatus TaxID=300417 RepID=UPI002ADD912F|nr:protein THEMIS2 [Syngnathoides biaculeatus]XP_061675298.1 protein THEMIS2 [Syngnathoides biaculeatus]XP_061675299.1 protein THEMIS2 [Syngnathoides biaculeatus]